VPQPIRLAAVGFLGIIAVLFVTFSYVARAQQPYLLTGTANLESCKQLIVYMATGQAGNLSGFQGGYCLGVVSAVMGTLDLYRGIPGRPGVGAICLPEEGSTIAQGLRVVVTFMERHPEFLHLSLPTLAGLAFHEAFPCRSLGDKLTR
jgi:hypothetical protein